MGRRAPGFNLTRFTSRLIGGVAAAALLVVAQASDHLRQGAAVDVLHAGAPAAIVPVLHPLSLQRVAAKSRSAPHRSGGFGAALPAPARAAWAGNAAQNAQAVAPPSANAPAVRRGYDATAPPALS
jgi:hypothetical protein